MKRGLAGLATKDGVEGRGVSIRTPLLEMDKGAIVALLDECVAELERRRAAARPAPLGELQRTATELRRLVASTTNSELHSMLSQTEAEIGRRHARRGR